MFALVFGLCAISPTHAIDPFEVKDIRVEGLQRIAPGTVFNYLPVKVGDTVDDESAKEAIRALFKTGFFKDVQLRQEGPVLVVSVVERPSIANIEFVGNKAFTEEDLKRALKDSGFAEGRVFDPPLLEKVEQELRSQYFSQGKYGASIKTTVTPLERNRVGVTVEVTEGDTARIRKINIVGNEVFDDDDLLDKFALGTKPRWNFLSKRDQYSKQKLAGDLESLRSFYQDQGYLDFTINSTQVSITPNKRDIYVTVSISEGERYAVSEYKLAGNPILSQEDLLALVTFQPGDVFSRKAVTETNRRLAERLADEGYAFANVNAVPDINKENRTVAFTFFVDPGRRAYVRRINIAGNTTTRDEVIRRELRQFEGSWFSSESVRRSRIRLQRLGFFDDVTIETPAVPGQPDQVDVNVTVKERPTGSLLFGLGYSDEEGVLLQASVSQRNLFGTGKELHVNVDNSTVSDVYNIRYINPYATINGISRGIQLFSSRVDAEQANTAEYIVETLGAALSYKIPISEYNSINVGLGYEQIDLEGTVNTPPEIAAFIAATPSSDLIKTTLNWSRDTRDSFLFPTDGSLNQIALELAIPGGDLEYYKLTYTGTYYRPVGRRLVFKAGGQLGYGDGFGDTEDLPFFKNFYAGGALSVRGYKGRSLGPRDSGTTPEPLGGSTLVLGSLEVLLPVPGLEDSKDKRLGLFIDAGQVYGPDQDVDAGELRYGAGVSFHWFSPLGPMSISYAVPFNDQEGDETESFQFTLGRLFR
jgi:outer membrane protein insertion porin family